MRLLVVIPFIFLSIALSGCGAAIKPIMSSKPTHIVGAEVTMYNIGATVNLPEDVRYKIAREATRYPTFGPAKTLKVNLKEFHVKNPVQSWLIGDSNRISAEVIILDKKTGRMEESFVVGYVYSGVIQGIAGAVLSAIDNPVDVEQELAKGLAQRIFIHLYGPKKAEIARQKKYGQIAAPKYPRSYESLKIERKCKMAAENAKIQVDKSAPPMEIEPTEECLKYFPKKKRRRYGAQG